MFTCSADRYSWLLIILCLGTIVIGVCLLLGVQFRRLLLILMMMHVRILFAQQAADSTAFAVGLLDFSALDSTAASQVAGHLQAWRSASLDTAKVQHFDALLEALPFTPQKAALGNWQLTQLSDQLSAAPASEKHFYQQAISNTLNHIVTTWFVLGELDTCKMWMQERLKLVTEYGLTENMADCHTDLGVLAIQVGQLDTALMHLNRAVTIYQTLKTPRHYANCLVSLGRVYKTRGDYRRAIELNQAALELREQAQDSVELGHSYAQLAEIHSEQHDYETSIHYWEQAMRQYALFGAPKATLLAGSQTKAARDWLALGDTAQALNLNKQALALCEKYSLPLMKVAALVALTEINSWRGDFAPARTNGDAALSLARELQHEPSIAHAQMALARLELETGHLPAALSRATEAYRLAQALQDIHLRMQTAQIMADACRESKLWEKAYQHQQEATTLRDELVNTENQQLIIRQQVQYDYDKKKALSDQAHQNELAAREAEQARQRTIIAATVAGALLLLILVAIIANRLALTRKQKRVIQQQAARLEALDESKTRFFNNVAHELRTPLTLMTGHLESMLSERFGGLNERQRKSVSVAKNNTNRLLELVTEILDLGRLESGRMELEEQPIRIKVFTERLYYTFEALADQLDISLELNYQLAPDCTLMLDLPKMEKVLNNLLNNAIKFTPRGGRVKLSAIQTSRGIEFAVEDTGPGIAHQDLDKVFERYYQSSASNQTAQGGTGIGLAVVRELAELHGGTASAQSVAGKGATFVVTLPLSRLTDPASAIKPAHEAVQLELPEFPLLEGKAATILVVEDNKEMQHYLAEILSEYARVLLAGDGVEALTLLETNAIDLATIDVMMPNMDGFELLRQLRASETHRYLPAVMLTARASEADKLEALTIGVNDYVTKPFSQQELLVRVANLLQNNLVRQQARVEERDVQDTPQKSAEHDFIDELRAIVNRQLDNPEFSVSHLAQEIGLSDKQLTRNVKKATGLTPLKFIRELKLRYAHEGLRAKRYDSVASAAYDIGIENPSYFTKLFTERFGKNPSEYLT